jgi:hypothetical protein
MVASLSDPSGDKEYWLSKAPYERLKAVETLRQLNYGYSQSTSRLQRVLEIVTSISGVHFEECYTARVIDELDGVEVNLINLDHLKINKQSTGKYKDLDDLENLP